jgi:hypothetical protein
MPTLGDYDQFQGLHWETGSLYNYFAYQGITAPHTNQPYSEAMFLGISGGIVMGYFTFDYQGYDPMVQILTRNTFDPLETIYKRLDIQSNVRQTANPEKGISNLLAVLESGSPAIVFADMFSLPYNALPQDEGMWGISPILVYGYDEDRDIVWIADRSRSALSVTTKELAIARGRTKKNKFRLQTHESPNAEKLGAAVRAGINDCIQLFTEPPPKGSKNNFGFLAFKKWENLLRNSTQRNSWAKEYPPGLRMYAALTSAFTDIAIFGKDGGAERQVFSQFLSEASLLLDKSELNRIADKFRNSAEAWDDLATALLPEEVLLLKETRDLMLRKHHLFLEKGSSALDEIHQIGRRLAEIKQQVSEEFPLNSSQASDLRESIANKITVVNDIESDAIQDLKAIMGDE